MARTSFTMVMLLLTGGHGPAARAWSASTASPPTRSRSGRARSGSAWPWARAAPTLTAMFVRTGLKLAAIGAAFGLVAALGLSRLMAALLFGVGAADPATFALVAAGPRVRGRRSRATCRRDASPRSIRWRRCARSSRRAHRGPPRPARDPGARVASAAKKERGSPKAPPWDGYVTTVPIRTRGGRRPGAGAAAFGSGISDTRASVVRSREAMDAAFCRAERTTLVGSMTPASTRFSYSSVRALKPSSALDSRTLATTTAPS